MWGRTFSQTKTSTNKREISIGELIALGRDETILSAFISALAVVVASGLYLNRVTFIDATAIFLGFSAIAVIAYVVLCRLGIDWNKKVWFEW